MTTSRAVRQGLIGLLGFGAVSAAAGGIGLVGGGIEFPRDWLEGTPFASYVGPGLILGLVVGGSQLAALVAVLRHAGWARLAAAAAGCAMMGWIVGEVVLVGSRDGVMLGLQALYFLNG
ncbi:MAG: hypothetical protein IRY97_10070, partial [Thermomicrobiaceae bacterium]|nr:hypothetical protein [Thermomicrobiaceae bacterium]